MIVEESNVNTSGPAGAEAEHWLGRHDERTAQASISSNVWRILVSGETEMTRRVITSETFMAHPFSPNEALAILGMLHCA